MRSIHNKRKRIFIAAVSIGSAVAIILGVIVWRIATSPNEALQNGVTPPFQTVLPKDTSIDTLGGWQKLTPPDGTSVYVFVDTIDGVRLQVTQQPLPKSFKTDTATHISELAKSYNASRSLDADGVKVYIGTSAQGPQSVIFTKNGLLVLIKSDASVPDTRWVTYVTALQ